jgi:two-component system, NtrC family, response regulator AlgB
VLRIPDRWELPDCRLEATESSGLGYIAKDDLMKSTQVQSLTALPRDSLVPLESVLCTEELNRRCRRPRNYETENRALVSLAQAMAESPRSILQTLADNILEVLQVGSAGISLLTKDDGGKRFYWPAIAGMWKPHVGGGTPRDFGPCGDVLDCSAPLLFRHFERRYPYLLPVTPPAEECLLVPFYFEGNAVGTIWAIAHNNRRKFDAEDLRQLVSLGTFASSAYQMTAFLDALDQQGETLRQYDTQVKNLEEQVRLTVPEAVLQSEEPAMRQALELAFKVAATEATVLLRGESGTGKGVLSRAIHARSPRAADPFVTVHCPSLSAELLESELFGHAKGSFTGAFKDTVGKVAVAEGGTLFLDEIGDLPLALQPKLLRVLQEKRYERVGETQTRVCNVRILAATNHDLEAQIAAGKFREDLFYRLNVIEVTLPSLRQRPHDIVPLAEHLLRFFARQSGKSATGFSGEAKDALVRYLWAGNVRELRNAIERGVILASGPVVGLGDLPVQVGKPSRLGIELGAPVPLEQIEAEHIRRILSTSGSIDEAAAVLGMNLRTLYRKRKVHGV